MRSSKDFFGNLLRTSGKNRLPEPDKLPVRRQQAGREAPQQNVGMPYEKGDFIGGKYEVCDTLGRGAFGVVYLVASRETGALYALKTFRDEHLADEVRERFRRKAQVWVDMERHPHLVQAHFIEEIGGRLYLGLEHVATDDEGFNSLDGYLRRRPPDLPQSLRWAIQFCHGMEHAYANGIRCHGDIKPVHILVDRDKNVKILPFGLWIEQASHAGDSAVGGKEGEGFPSCTARAGSNSPFGTPGYMAPEVFRGEGVDVRSDVYSFGVVLWQMGTGSPLPPFAVGYGGNVGECLQAVYEQQVAGRVPHLDGPLGAVLERCLDRDPNERYQSFGELRSDLERVAEDSGGSAGDPMPSCKLAASGEVNRGVFDYHWIGSLAGGMYRYVKPLGPTACVAQDVDGKVVAIKRSEFAGPDGFPTDDSPHTEVQIHARLSHPNIAKLVRWHDEAGALFVVTEYVAGESIARRFFSRPGEQEEVLSLLAQVAKATAYLHGSGLVHRDITPDNVIVAGERAFLIDFGAAADYGETGPREMRPISLHQNWLWLFRHGWCRPPETLYSPSSDVYYLGLLGLFMLTGTLLLHHYGGGDGGQWRIELTVQYLRSLQDASIAGLMRVLQKAVSPLPELRFKNGQETLAALEGLS